MTKLLLDEKPLMVMPSLAVKIGLPESLFLQQLHYWLEKSTNIKVGHAWVYNTVKEWQVQFPFWSESTIRRIIDKLEKKELLITDNFNKLSIDQTKWYRINYEVLHEMDSEKPKSRNRKPSSQNEHMGCSKRADGLSNLNTPLPESTSEITTEINNNNDNARMQKEIAETPFSFYQENGFGILTPHVGEKIGSWIDDTNEELVIHAMKISVENSVPRWSYAETILRDWQNKKITSVSDVLAAEKQREQQKNASKKSYAGRPAREEHTPDWFKDKQAQTEQSSTSTSDDFDLAEERRKLLEELGVEGKHD